MAKIKKIIEINEKEEFKSRFKMNILLTDNNNVSDNYKRYDIAIVKMKTTGETIEEFNLNNIDDFEKEIKKTIMQNELIVYDYVTEGDNVIFNCITLEEFYLANYFGDGGIEYIKDEDFEEEVEKFNTIVKEIKDESRKEVSESRKEVSESRKEVSESRKEVDNPERRSTSETKIIITEELAKECGYKSLRGLKMAISRKHGKGTYNPETGEIDVVKLVTVIAKRASAEVIERLISKDGNSVDEQDSTEEIYNKAKKIIEELKIRKGEFVYNEYDADEISSILAEMYHAKEITYAELRNVTKRYKLDLDITYSENLEKWERNTAQHIYTNYSNYIENNKESKIIYGTVDPNLSYEQQIECEWAYEQYADDIKERDRIVAEAKENVLEDDILAITLGYEDSSTYLCIYKNKNIVGHYKYEEYEEYKENDWKDLEQKILKLFELENIEKKHIGLLYKFKEMQEKQFENWERKQFENKKKRADYCFAKGEETFIFVQEFENKGFSLYCYQNAKEINSHTFENKFGTLAFVQELKELKDKDNKEYGKHFRYAITQMQNISYATAEEENEKYEKQKESWNDYKNYTYNSFSNNSLNAEEKKIFKKVYKIAAMKMHPDVCADGGENMRILNGLKDKLLA